MKQTCNAKPMNENLTNREETGSVRAHLFPDEERAKLVERLFLIADEQDEQDPQLVNRVAARCQAKPAAAMSGRLGAQRLWGAVLGVIKKLKNAMRDQWLPEINFAFSVLAVLLLVVGIWQAWQATNKQGARVEKLSCTLILPSSHDQKSQWSFSVAEGQLNVRIDQASGTLEGTVLHARVEQSGSPPMEGSFFLTSSNEVANLAQAYCAVPEPRGIWVMACGAACFVVLRLLSARSRRA